MRREAGETMAGRAMLETMDGYHRGCWELTMDEVLVLVGCNQSMGVLEAPIPLVTRHAGQMRTLRR